jgi:hypothetical protein
MFCLKDRAYVRLTAVFRYVSDDTWSLVSALGRRLGLSRSTIYRDIERIEQALSGNPPGRPADPTRTLVRRIEELETQQGVLAARVADLEARLDRSVEVTPQRIENLVLTAVTRPPSYEGIGEYLARAFGESYRPSPGTISQWVTQFGTTAGLILTDLRVTDRFDEASCDELFVGRHPILTVVEPASLAIGAVEWSDHRDAQDWQVVLERFRHLRYVSSDLGTGLQGGIGLCPQILRHHPDFWHLVVRPLSGITRSLEAGLERTWDQERQALACRDLPKGSGKLYAPTLERIRKDVEGQFDRMEHYYQGLERLFEAFEPLVDEPGTPHLRTSEEAERLLNQALEHLLAVNNPSLDAFIQKLEAHREQLFGFLHQLHEQIAQVPLEGLPDPRQAEALRALVLREILLTRQRAHSQDPKVLKAYTTCWQEIARLGPLQKHYLTWRTALAECVYRPRRTSSLVEAVNSPLRTLTQIHRNPSQPLLDLFALHHNMTPFGQGCKRKGVSPYRRLGVDLGTEDWIEALRTYRLAS